MASSSLFLHPAVAAPFRALSFSTKATLPPPGHEKKSFAVATGELFLGITARILNRNGKIVGGGELPAPENERGWWRRNEGIGAVVEDPVQPEIVWEQGVKDVEAERRRKAVTSPGFSFSAAGLLFPYHLGVARLLIEKGYIKVLLP